MKLGRAIFRITTKTPTLFHSQSPLHNNLNNKLTASYSTKTVIKPRRRHDDDNVSKLYRRISPVGDPNVSIVPILDQWILEGQIVTQSQLRDFIRELRHYRRFKHALEISYWMSDKRYMFLSVGDVAVRLDLIGKVHGIEEAENYFNSTPKQMKTIEVYGSLLNCYAHGKCVDKAYAVVKKMTELGYAMCTVNYNVLLNLYYQTENYEKAAALLHEMEVKQIKFDRYTYSILLATSGADSGIDKIEEILKRIEADAEVDIDWMIYTDIANRFIKAGSVDEALIVLRKAEKFVVFSKKKNEVFSYIITLYASAGKKEEVLRVWNECKKFKVYNRDYICMLPSILKFDDVETAEKIMQEWKASELSKDIRIPNILIGYYCRKGSIEKAEALIETVKMENWEKVNSWTWYWMSFGYSRTNQMPKAVEAMEIALFEHISRSRWKPEMETLVACLKYLKEEGDIDRSNNFVSLLMEKGIVPEEISHKLLAYFSGECAFEDGWFENFPKLEMKTVGPRN